MNDNSDKVPKTAAHPNLTGGSRKGKPNKTTQLAKEAIAYAADKLGGADRLVDWVKEDPRNESAFWSSIYPKLLPLQINGAGENGEHLLTSMVVTFVKPDAS